MADLANVYAPWAGNAEALATDIGERGVTVRQWRNRGSIHHRYWPKIIAAAAARGFALKADDFLDGAADHAAPDTAPIKPPSPGNGAANSPVAAGVQHG